MAYLTVILGSCVKLRTHAVSYIMAMSLSFSACKITVRIQMLMTLIVWSRIIKHKHLCFNRTINVINVIRT